MVHAWDQVERWIRYEDLFRSDLHARAFRALMAHPTVPEAIEAADPGVAELLTRLATEEVETEPFDAVVRLLTETARRAVSGLTAAGVRPPRRHRAAPHAALAEPDDRPAARSPRRR